MAAAASFPALPPVADTLLTQYTQLTAERVESSGLQGDGQMAKEHGVYEQLLKSLRLLAKHAAAQLLDTLLYWRTEALKGYKGKSIAVSQKKLIIELSFLEAVLEILKGAPGSDVHNRQATSLLKLAFEWVLKCHVYVPDPELEKLRSLVTQHCGWLLSAMTPFRLAIISDMFIKELRSRMNGDGAETFQQERAALFRLCQAMKGIRMGFGSDEEVIMATKFLEDMNPLNYVAKEKKSQIHHALSDMLTAILRRVGSDGDIQQLGKERDAQVMQQWYKSAAHVRTDISKWALDQKKHYSVGYPLLAALIALEPEAAFSVQMKTLVEQVHGKLMKDSKTRILTLRCLQECVQAYLERYGSIHSEKQVNEWLTNCLKTPIANVCKGTLSLEPKPGQDMGATVLTISQIVASKAPVFAVKGIILELLQSDLFSCQHIGLQALLNMVLSAPAFHSTRHPNISYPGSSPSQQVMEIMRGGTSPLELCGVAHLSAPIAEAIGKVLSNCQMLFGGLHVTVVARNIGDHVPKEKLTGLLALRAALLCIPYVPNAWTAQKQAEMLASYTKHSHQDVRQQAIRALHRTLRCQPAMRPCLVAAMARDVAAIPDSHRNVIESGLRLLMDICSEWVKLLQARPMAVPVPGGLESEDLDSDVHLHQLEGLGLTYLASNEPSIRVLAMDLLRCAQLLHRTMAVAKHSAGKPSALYATAYTVDVIEQVGDEIAQSCYWDFGRFSDLWRTWRPLPPDIHVGLWPLLSGTHKLGVLDVGNDAVRWARCLSELVRHISILCPKSVALAYHEVSSRCYRMLHSQEGGQMVFRGSQVLETVARQSLWRNYSALACACPPSVCVAVQSSADSPRNSMPLKSMLQLVLQSIRHSQELHFPGYMSLGQCRTDRSEFLLDELKKTLASAEDRAKTKSKVSPGELRVVFAHVVRLMAANASATKLRMYSGLMAAYLDFVLTTADYIQRSNEFMYWDCQQLRYCCCSVTASLAEPMMCAGVLSLPQRKSLFSVFEAWYSRAGELMREVQTSKDVMGGSRELQAVLSKVKDMETMKNVRMDMVEQCKGLQTMALCARAALVSGESLDGDGRLQGTVGGWIHSMFSSKASSSLMGPTLQQVAHTALLNLLKSNLDLLPSVIDRCYLNDASVSNLYFHVVAEVYSREIQLQSPAHILLSLVLYKMVDPSPEVRDDALTVLDVLVARMWASSGVAQRHVGAAVVGSLQDSYQEFQCQLSSEMAREHPELSQNLCIEMLTRVLNVADKVTRHQILICLPPWMQNLSFTGRESSSNAVLKSLYYVQWQHGAQFPYELERLWSTLAGNRRNIIPILDFLVCKGLDEGAPGDLHSVNTYFSVAKRISLYVARVASQQTVDHLVYEMSQQLYEEDDSYHSTATTSPRVFFERESSEEKELMGSIEAETPNGSNSGGGVLRTLSQASTLRTSSASISIAEAMADGVMPEPSVSPITMTDNSLTRPLTRSELSLCLLAEVAYEHDEDFRSHLPLLFHMALICMDASEPTVSHHCSLLVVNLLYSLGIRHLEAGGGGLASQVGILARVSGTIKQLQSMAGQRLWMYEDTTLEQPHLRSFDTLQALVNGVLEAIVFESDLRERWGEEALKWAVECSSRHLSGRSLQVFRALRLPLSSHGAACMLYCLHMVLTQAAANVGDGTALQCAMEILLTLQLLVDSTPAPKLILYPQLFWACISLLPMPYPQLYREVLGLLYRILAKMDFNQVAVQNVLVAAAPGSQAWELELSLSQSPPGSLRSSLASTRLVDVDGPNAHAAALQERPWGEVPPWKAGEHLLNSTSDSATSAAAPASKTRATWHTVALQQLLMKGLLDDECCGATINVLMYVLSAMAAEPNNSAPHAELPSMQVNSVSSCGQIKIAIGVDALRSHITGTGVILGPLDTQLLVSMLGLLPWVFVHRGSYTHGEAAEDCAELLAAAARSQGYKELGAALAGLTVQQPLSPSAEDFVAQLCEPLVFTFFPRYAKLFCQILLAILSVGPPRYHSVCLALLRSVLEVPRGRLGSAEDWLTHPGSFSAVADIISQGCNNDARLADQALGLLDVVMQRFPGDSRLNSMPMTERWKVAGCRMTPSPVGGGGLAGMEPNGNGGIDQASSGGDGNRSLRGALLQPENGLAMCCEALEAVLGTCHKAHAGRANNSKRGFMPFCQESSRKHRDVGASG